MEPGVFWLFTESNEYCLPKGVHIIGRYDGYHRISIAHKSVSRSHVLIRIKEFECLVKDFNSKNGLFVNEERLKGGDWRSVVGGETIRIGAVECKLLMLPKDMAGKIPRDFFNGDQEVPDDGTPKPDSSMPTTPADAYPSNVDTDTDG